MSRHPVRPFVVAVWLFFSMGYSLPSLADEPNTLPVTMVTTADYQIGAEGLPDSRQRSKSRAATSSSAQTKRQLVSLYGGESGDSIPERGYLTDVVWGEKTTYPAASVDAQPVTQERILYYSFNVGQWKRKLNSETSVLTRAFMTQPLLVFLSDEDKATVAEYLVKTPLFKKAVAVHRAQVGNSLADISLLNDLVMALGENGVNQATEEQRKISQQALRSEITHQAKTIQNLTFSDNSQEYSVFDGMAISGNKNSQLDFKSYSSLYYGIQPLSEFRNTDGDFGAYIDRHISGVDLIEPVSGWLDKEAIPKETTLSLGDISTNLENNNKLVNIAIFRNNPYVLFDAPQSMNFMTLLAIITKVGGESLAVFKPKLAKTLMEDLKEQTKKLDAIKKRVALTYSVVSTGQQLICSLQEQKEGICGDALQKLQKLASMIPDAIKSTDDLLEREAAKQGANFTNTTSTFCGAGLALDLASSLFSPLEQVNDGSKKFRFTLCMIDKVITAPLLGLVETVLPDDYQKLTDKKYNSVHLTADYLVRIYKWAAFVKPVEKGYRIESLVGKLLVNKAVNVKGVLATSVVAMQSATNVTKFLQDVKNNKVEMQPLLVHLGEALQNHLKKNGKAMLTNLTYDLLMTITPGKYLQLANTIGNEGSKLLWDWVTDPSVVKLTMTRTTNTQTNANELQINHAIPEFKGIRYLTIPIEDAAAFPTKPAKVLDYSEGIKDIGKWGNDKLLAVSNAPDTNHLLVYADFKASVENQSAYLKEDKDAVNNYLTTDKVWLRWHVKKFNASADIVTLPYEQRNASNAFNGDKNNIAVPVKKGWTWWTDSIIDLNGSKNPLHQANVLGAAQSMYYALDFTEIYRHQLGDKQAYPLTHETPGIYSDYTHIKIQSGADEKLYQNTFNIYVLPNLNAVTAPGSQTQINLNSSLKKSSRIYCEEDTCTKNGELQLNFAGADVWDQIGRNGLWAVWMQADGIMASEPIAVRTTAGGTVTSTLRIPEDININVDYLIIYEDVMNAYLQHSGRAKVEVLRTAFMQRIRTNDRRYPVIALNLKELKNTVPTSTPLLKPLDSDSDGVPDTLDAFPNNPQYSYDTDSDTMPDEWENQYSLDIFTDDSVLDLDNDGIGNLDEFKAGTDPAFLPLILSGAGGDKQVALTWNAINGAAYVLCYATETIADVNDCLNYAGGKWVNIASGTQYTVKGLTNGKNYYFRVNAENNVQILAISNLLTVRPGKAYTLNDTGITACSDDDQNGLPCPQDGHPGQDAEFGRDVKYNSSTDGHAGFSFTKISSTGEKLPASATSFNCVKDNVTGLIWEVKTDDGGLRDKDWYYTWYEPDASKNGGFAGYQNGGSCGGTSACDTYVYAQAVNAAGLCGKHDWRLPTVSELRGIASLDRYSPAIDSAYFPNTQSAWYWSSSPVAGYSYLARNVYFDNGDVSGRYKDDYGHVRLVRSGQ